MKFKTKVMEKGNGYDKDGNRYKTYSITSKELKEFAGKEVVVEVFERFEKKPTIVEQ